MGRGHGGVGGRGRRGGLDWEEEMGKGAMAKGDREGLTGRGIRERGKGEGEKKGKRRGDFTDGYDEMPGWKEVTVFSLFTRATPGTPASLY